MIPSTMGSSSINIAKSSIKLITFDVTNTLIRVRGSVGDFYSKAALRFGLQIGPETLNLNFRSSYKEYDSRYPNFGVQHGLSSEKWWKNVVKSTLTSRATCTVDEQTLDALSSTLYQDFVDASRWEVFPEATDVLRHLCAKGYCLGVISNFDERLNEILKALQLQKYFSFTIPSVKAKACKPSAEIFRFALKEAGVKAQESLHIGDSVLLDYRPATELGMQALLVDRLGSFNGTGVVNSVQVIQDLKPLLSL